jgi:lysophospholipase L1-like esterase
MPLTPPPSAPPAAPPAPGDAPSRTSPGTFRGLADAFVLWLVGFRDSLADLRGWLATYIAWAGTHVTELNALQADVDAAAASVAGAAEDAATASAAAASAAVFNDTGRVFTAAEGTAAGLADAGITTGQRFAVLAADGKSFTLYRKDAGPAATQITTGYTAAYLDTILRRSRGTAIFRIVNAARTKVALEITNAGRLLLWGRDVLTELDVSKVIGNAFKASGIPRGSARIALRDSQGKAPLVVSRTGRVLVWNRDVLTELDALAPAAALYTVRENPSYLAFQFKDGAGKSQIKTFRKSDGKVTVLTTTGNNLNPFLTSDNRVLFVSDASGAYVQKHVPADGGTIFDTLATSDYAAWGDSLTAGTSGMTPYPTQLAALLGRDFYNGGIGGQWASEIAARQGGTPSLLTVTGNQIPASGSVVVTSRTVNLITSQGQQAFTGTLAGVAGTLDRVVADGYRFTRSVPGSVVACPPGTPFIPDVAVTNRGRTAILIYGRNGVLAGVTPSQLLALIASSIAYLSPYNKQFLVGLILNQTTETVGSANYLTVKASNDAIKAAYPNNYLDTQAPPSSAEMTALGFTPNSTDLADIANDAIPTGMRAPADTLHLNTTGYALWALRAKNLIQAKGW